VIIGWKNEYRPGFFGRRRDVKVLELDMQFGKGGWRLAHVVPIMGGAYTEDRYKTGTRHQAYAFVEACKKLYEESYYFYLVRHPDTVDFICSFGEVYDNALTNRESGLDYEKQEAFSTHIQDIAVRNVLARLGRRFEGNPEHPLQIRGPESEGWILNPGNIPFRTPEIITVPSLRPSWAGPGSVEDAWQSMKWVQTPIDDGIPDLEV